MPDKQSKTRKANFFSQQHKKTMSKTIDLIPCPPSLEDLQQLDAQPAKQIPKKYTRDIENRIFVNRTVNMETIKYVGFDMDYTLAVYKSPAYEELGYNLALKKLIKKGYPKDIENLKYDPTFPIRYVILCIIL